VIGPIEIEEIESLKPMPASVVQLAGMIADADANISDIARVVELDQALTANLLRMANSAWGRSRTPILTVSEAVKRLGTAQVLKLAVGREVAHSMVQAFPGYELAEHELWRHSVAAALAAEGMSSVTSKPVPGAAFTGALLHDIGKLLLSRHLGVEALQEIGRVVEADGLVYLEAERKLLGADHAQVGGAIARHWRFPDPLVSAIEFHHEPDAHPCELLDVVHIANAVAKLIGVGLGSEQMNLRVSGDAARRMGMSAAGLESLCARVETALAEAEEVFVGGARLGN